MRFSEHTAVSSLETELPLCTLTSQSKDESLSPNNSLGPSIDTLESHLKQTLTFAEHYKTIGNQLFKKNHYDSALSAYTKAIDLCLELPEPPQVGSLHIYYTNRALCQLKLENYGLAILDAESAIAVCPTFSKAYYRRGCSYAALGKFQNALKDFQTAYRLKQDPDTGDRIKECQREIRQIKFAKAISSEKTKPLSETLDLSTFDSGLDSYTGPRYRREPEFLNELIDYLETPGNTLHKRYIYSMVLDMIKELQKLGNIVEIELEPAQEFTICGDIHGQYYDLLNIFKINGLPSTQNPYLFNGDFVDRGSFSVECITVLFAAKLIYPNHVHLARGNHETRNMNKIYGFKGEVESKYDKLLYELFCESFCRLPLAHLINKRVFIVHGGLFANDGVKLSDIEKLDRFVEPTDDGIMTEMLWSDPQIAPGRTPSKRGVACAFGPDVTESFLSNNNLEYIIRSHEVKLVGYSVEHDGKLITVFSAPNYCDSLGNQGAFIRLRGDNLKPNFVQFDAVAHPSVRPLQYASSLFGILS